MSTHQSVTTHTRKLFRVVLLVFIASSIAHHAFGQGLFDSVKKRVNRAASDAGAVVEKKSNISDSEDASPSLAEAQAILDATESNVVWNMSSSLAKQWEDYFGFKTDGPVRANALKDDVIAKLRGVYKIRDGEKFLMATHFMLQKQYEHKIAVTDKAVYLITDEENCMPKGLLRFPHASFLQMVTKPIMLSDEKNTSQEEIRRADLSSVTVKQFYT